MEDRKAVIVGISGASSSGKTTLARLLRDVFPGTFILHEDDFYKPEAELPTKDGLLDWDCAESLSIPAMTRALSHIRAHGTFPPFVDSKEDQNSIGACPVSSAAISLAKAKVSAWLQPGQPGHSILIGEDHSHHPSRSSSRSTNHPDSPPATPRLRICLVDGFLLYSAPLERGGVPSLLDTRLFLRVSRSSALQRRQRRDGYVTLEGFWKDPPGYVERVVWPNYVAAHGFLFEGGDVERGRWRRDVLGEKGILVFGGGEEGKGEGEGEGEEAIDVPMETTFAWAVDTLMRQLEELAGKGKGTAAT